MWPHPWALARRCWAGQGRRLGLGAGAVRAGRGGSWALLALVGPVVNERMGGGPSTSWRWTWRRRGQCEARANGRLVLSFLKQGTNRNSIRAKQRQGRPETSRTTAGHPDPVAMGDPEHGGRERLEGGGEGGGQGRHRAAGYWPDRLIRRRRSPATR